MRAAAVALAAASAVLLGGCTDGPEDPGTMTSEQYRSLEARGTDLTVADVVDRGGIESAQLEERFVREGGEAADPAFECYYAETTRRTRYQGTARFCFADGAIQTVERNRSDVPDA